MEDGGWDQTGSVTGTGIRPTAAGNSLSHGELDLIKDFTLD